MTTAPRNVPQTADTTSDDPYAVASNAAPRAFGPYHAFGELTQFEAYFVVSKKGEAVRPWSPQSGDTPANRSTRIVMQLAPTRGKVVERQTLDWAGDWVKITQPSLKALGVPIDRSLKGRFFEVEMAPDGRKYQRKGADGNPSFVQDDTGQFTPEMGEGSCFKFLNVFATATEMQAAADAFFGTDDSASSAGQAPAPSSYMPEATLPDPAASAAVTNAARQFAQQSLSMLWDVSGHDVEQFTKQLASNPMVSQYFTIDSPEVRSIITRA